MVPKISIVVPVYNVKDILPYCIDSILNQSYKDFEVLMVDDGSTDGSGLLCDELAKKDSRIHVFHKPNGGLSDARNYGIEQSSGENLLFIDSDDVLHRDFCKVLIDAQNKYASDISSVDLINFYSTDEIQTLDNAKYSSTESLLENDDILREYFKPSGNIRIYHGLCMKLYKRELFETLRFTKGRLHEDLYITYKLLDKCKKFVYINLPYYYYFQKNVNSITKNYREKNLVDEYDALQLIKDYFRDKDSIKNELNFFLVNHYCYLLYKSNYLEKNQNVIYIRNEVKSYLRKKLIGNKSLPFAFKLKIFIRINFYFLFSYK